MEVERNGETTPLLQSQLVSHNNDDLTVNMEDLQEEEGRKNYALPLLGAITIGLSTTCLVIAAVVTLTAIIGNQPSSVIDNELVITPFYWISLILYCIIITLIIAQYITMKKSQQEIFVNDKQYNKFLFYVVLVVFLPATEAYLIFRLIKEICQRHCHKDMTIYIIRSFVEIFFIPAVVIYTLKMCQKRAIGSKVLVVITKVTIVTVVITFMSKWIYLAVADAADTWDLVVHLTPAELEDCQFTNSTIDQLRGLGKWSYYLYPYLLEIALACSALLYGPYYMSRIDINLPDERSEEELSRTSTPWRTTPIVISVIVFVICLVPLGINMNIEGGAEYDLIEFTGSYTIVFIISIVAMVILFKQIPYTKYHPMKIPADRVLLWISTLGPILKSIAHVQGCVILFQSNKTALGLPHITNGRVGIDFIFYLLLLVQVILQSVLLDISLRRRIGMATPMVRKFRPALVLMVVNLGLWFDHCFMANAVNSEPQFDRLFGSSVWNAMHSIWKPLFSLQRIHSASLFYEIYKSGG